MTGGFTAVGATDSMEWSERGITLEGTRFRVAFGPEIKLDSEELHLLKPRWMVERYAKLIDELRPKRIFELGIYHGGSVAFLALLAKPDRHVAIDLQPSPSRRFEEWLGSHSDVVRTRTTASIRPTARHSAGSLPTNLPTNRWIS